MCQFTFPAAYVHIAYLRQLKRNNITYRVLTKPKLTFDKV